MRHRFNGLGRVLLAGALLTAGAALGPGQEPPKPDNTKTNQADRKAGEPTADQQKNNITDRQATQRIRRSLMHDKGLSTYAHNVKVIARDGQVTLKGPVRSDAEKQTVEEKATEVVGAGHVVNELSVAPGRSKRTN